jgi:hypothetical protein
MPRESDVVQPGKSVRTPRFSAPYDGAPSLYSFAVTPIRSPGARLHSYDGRGHGFIFMVATRQPMRFRDISEVGLWDELEIPDYRMSLDPRTLVRDFAVMISQGQPFTLEFAEAFGTTNMSSSMDAYQDCLALSFLPLGLLGYSHRYHFITSFSYPRGCFDRGFTRFAWFPGFQNDYGWNSAGRQQYWNPGPGSDTTAADSAAGMRRIDPRRRGQSGRTLEFAPRINDRFGSDADFFPGRPGRFSPRDSERAHTFEPANRAVTRSSSARASGQAASPRATHRPERTTESRPSAPARSEPAKAQSSSSGSDRRSSPDSPAKTKPD